MWGCGGVPGQSCSSAEHQQPQHYSLFALEKKQPQEELWGLGPQEQGRGGVQVSRAGRNGTESGGFLLACREGLGVGSNMGTCLSMSLL